MDKASIKEFLTRIKPSIELIDGGCGHCIAEFCENINPILKEVGLKVEHDEENYGDVLITEIQ